MRDVATKSTKVVLEDGTFTSVTATLKEQTPKDLWEDRDYYIDFCEKSKEYWNTMSTDQQQALVRKTRIALERFYDTIEEWLPESLDAKAGAGYTLDIVNKVIFTDINEEVEREEVASKLKVREAVNELANQLGISIDA